MNLARPVRTSDQLHLNDHVCLVYETQAEHERVLTPYLRAGLERNEKVVYLADYSSGAAIAGYLKRAGVDVDAFLRRGQLSVQTASLVYLPNGAFDPAAMLQFIAEATRQALAEGYAGLRVTGEMTWVLEGRPGCDRILEYESKANGFFTPGCQAVGLCQYRRSRFDAKTLLEILHTHPIAGVDGEFQDNPYYVPPEQYLSPHRADAVLDNCLAALRNQKPLSHVA